MDGKQIEVVSGLGADDAAPKDSKKGTLAMIGLVLGAATIAWWRGKNERRHGVRNELRRRRKFRHGVRA